MAVEFDMPLPDDPDEEEERKVSMKADSGEKSTRTRDLVQFWFVSQQEWGGPHGGPAYRLKQAQAEKAAKNKKRQKRVPTQGEDTPFTDGTLKLQPRIDETLNESMANFVDCELKQLQAINKKAVIWTVQEFNDWNQKEGARVRRLEKSNHIGLP